MSFPRLSIRMYADSGSVANEPFSAAWSSELSRAMLRGPYATASRNYSGRTT